MDLLEKLKNMEVTGKDIDEESEITLNYMVEHTSNAIDLISFYLKQGLNEDQAFKMADLTIKTLYLSEINKKLEIINSKMKD